MYGGGDAQTPRLGQLLNPLRQDNARTGDCVIRDDHLPERDPGPDLRSDVVCEHCVLFRIGDLKRQSGQYAVRCTGKLRDQGISAQLMGNAAVRSNNFCESPEGILNSFMRHALILLNKRG